MLVDQSFLTDVAVAHLSIINTARVDQFATAARLGPMRKPGSGELGGTHCKRLTLNMFDGCIHLALHIFH